MDYVDYTLLHLNYLENVEQIFLSSCKSPIYTLSSIDGREVTKCSMLKFLFYYILYLCTCDLPRRSHVGFSSIFFWTLLSERSLKLHNNELSSRMKSFWLLRQHSQYLLKVSVYSCIKWTFLDDVNQLPTTKTFFSWLSKL